MTLTPAGRVRDHARPHDEFAEGKIQASIWGTPAGFEPVSLGEAEGRSATRCFVLNSGTSAADAYTLLAPICGVDLGVEMLEDLVDADPLPVVGNTSGSIRKVSAFAAVPTPASHEGGMDSAVGGLTFELVEFLAGDDWLVLRCHEQHSVAAPHAAGSDCPALLTSAGARPAASSVESATELGMLLLHEMTRSFAMAGGQLLRWMDLWEKGLYAHRASGSATEIDTAPLVTLRGLGTEFGARLHAMDRSAHSEAANWFVPDDGAASPMAARLGAYAHANVNRAVADVDRLSTMVRSAMDLVQTRRMADHLHLQQVQADRTEELQVRVERITSLFLVPSLIAAFFGANTGLPGGNGDHAWESLAIMCFLMVVGAAGVWIVLGRIRARAKGRRNDGKLAA